MKGDTRVTAALERLSREVNLAIEQSDAVRDVIESLRALGFEPDLAVHLAISLEEMKDDDAPESEQPELEFTDDDIRALKRMKIAV
ncbi:MAG TPA: hypothetical protein PKO33_02775 [Pyrinomonadaceae bacterium]|nr:hypothetical protein [Pyrinomonadaceae bacterium]